MGYIIKKFAIMEINNWFFGNYSDELPDLGDVSVRIRASRAQLPLNPETSTVTLAEAPAFLGVQRASPNEPNNLSKDWQCGVKY
jgi:hypothetical protein